MQATELDSLPSGQPVAAATAAEVNANGKLAASVGRSALYGIIGSAAQVGTRLISVPVVIHYLGLSGYGIWSVIMVTAGYMRFGSAGLKSAFQKYVAEATGTGDYSKASKLVSTGSLTILALSGLGLIPVAFFSRRLAQSSGVPAEFLSSTAICISVLACIYMISNFGGAFESVVMGMHRIDLARKYNTILTVCEAIGIIVALRLGYGLVAMTVIMGTSELIYMFLCFLLAHKIAPQMHIGPSNFTRSMYPELVRFAGSYQLVNFLELIYAAVLPVVLLKTVGANAVGIYAVAGRIVTSSLMAQEALVLPILSAGTMVFASGASERARLFLAKSFKATLAAAIPPLALVASFGVTCIYVWTGNSDPQFRTALWLITAAAFFTALSRLQLILYRASGKVLLDNIRQVARIVVILVVALGARRFGLSGMLAGLALSELAGVAFMFFAMATTFQSFSGKVVFGDALRISAATALIVGAGFVFGSIPIPWSVTDRTAALLRLVEIGTGCLLAAWPAIVVTKVVSPTERRTLIEAVLFRRKKAVAMGAAA